MINYTQVGAPRPRVGPDGYRISQIEAVPVRDDKTHFHTAVIQPFYSAVADCPGRLCVKSHPVFAALRGQLKGIEGKPQRA